MGPYTNSIPEDVSKEDVAAKLVKRTTLALQLAPDLPDSRSLNDVSDSRPSFNRLPSMANKTPTFVASRPSFSSPKASTIAENVDAPYFKRTSSMLVKNGDSNGENVSKFTNPLQIN